jgi:hypothetical protein
VERENTLGLLKVNDEQERMKRYKEMLVRRQNNTNYWEIKQSLSNTNKSSQWPTIDSKSFYSNVS